jgi:hypothetical protein
MQTTLEHMMARPGLGTQGAIGSRGRGSSLQARIWRRMDHVLVWFVACAAWFIPLALIVVWATGYALEL